LPPDILASEAKLKFFIGVIFVFYFTAFNDPKFLFLDWVSFLFSFLFKLAGVAFGGSIIFVEVLFLRSIVFNELI
jgi:hypothetical protein